MKHHEGHLAVGGPLRLCDNADCADAWTHYVNCPRCFGYGLYTTAEDRTAPLSSSLAEAVRARRLDLVSVPCSFCNSTAYGTLTPPPAAPIALAVPQEAVA